MFEGLDQTKVGTLDSQEFFQVILLLSVLSNTGVSTRLYILHFTSSHYFIFPPVTSSCVFILFFCMIALQALTQMGYRFSPQFVDNLIAKYNPKGRRLTLDNFIVAFAQGLT